MSLVRKCPVKSIKEPGAIKPQEEITKMLESTIQSLYGTRIVQNMFAE